MVELDPLSEFDELIDGRNDGSRIEIKRAKFSNI